MAEINATSEQPSTQLTNGRRPLAARRTFSVWQMFVVAMVMLTSLGGYLLVLKLRGPDARIITKIDLDDVIPFQPGWVWVYLIPYLIGPVVIGFMRRATFHWYISRGIAVMLITLIIFIVFPTQTAERPGHDVGGWTGQLYDHMIAIDKPPANAAPSLHVSLTFLLAMALLMDFPRWWWLSTSGVVLVWLATLFTRQHHFIDVGTGILVASLVVCAWPRRRSGSLASSPDNKPAL